jgi:hypothetical protein
MLLLRPCPNASKEAEKLQEYTGRRSSVQEADLTRRIYHRASSSSRISRCFEVLIVLSHRRRPKYRLLIFLLGQSRGSSVCSGRLFRGFCTVERCAVDDCWMRLREQRRKGCVRFFMGGNLDVGLTYVLPFISMSSVLR